MKIKHAILQPNWSDSKEECDNNSSSNINPAISQNKLRSAAVMDQLN